MKFIVENGQHSDASGKKYLKGETVESASDLTVIFKNKFKKVVEEDTPDTDIPEKKEDNPEETEALEETEAPEEIENGGENVTSQFDIAVENNIKVIKTKGWYNLFDSEEEDAKINDNGLREAGVVDAIENYLKD
jgi:hypothetical protein